MKRPALSLLLGLAATAALSACVHKNSEQSRGAPLPAAPDEDRVRERIRTIRALDPSLTPQQARAQAVSEVTLSDVRAEAEWREKQKADQKKEDFKKTLDASLEKPR